MIYITMSGVVWPSISNIGIILSRLEVHNWFQQNIIICCWIKPNRYTSALEGLFKYVMDVFDKDLRPMVEDIFVDGSGGCENAIAKSVPTAIGQ